MNTWKFRTAFLTLTVAAIVAVPALTAHEPPRQPVRVHIGNPREHQDPDVGLDQNYGYGPEDEERDKKVSHMRSWARR